MSNMSISERYTRAVESWGPDRLIADIAKDTNPKDAAAVSRVPLHLFPASARMWGAMAFYEGSIKYGPYNWREADVKASVYYSALGRHMDAWWDGEDTDKKSGLPHLAKAIACIAILIDAVECGVLTDDRPPPGTTADLLDHLVPLMEKVRKLTEEEAS